MFEVGTTYSTSVMILLTCVLRFESRVTYWSNRRAQKSKMAAVGMRFSSSSEDENTAKTLKQRSKICYMHLTYVNKEPIQDFTAKRWETFKNCVERWLCLSGESKTIPETYKHCVTIDFSNIPEDAGFHATCYRRFIDRKRLDSAEKHSREHSDVNEAPGGESVLTADASSTSGSTSETPRKKLRERNSGPGRVYLLFPLVLFCLPCASYVRK